MNKKKSLKRYNLSKKITIEEAYDIIMGRYNINGHVGICYNKDNISHPFDEKYISYNYMYTAFDPNNLSYCYPSGGGCFWESEIKELTKKEFIKLADSRLDLFRPGSELYEQVENNRKLYQEKMAVIEKKLCYKLFDKISWKEFFSDPNMIICIGFLVIFLWFIFNVE